MLNFDYRDEYAPKKEKKKKEVIDGGLLRSLACIFTGWLGLSILAVIVSSVMKLIFDVPSMTEKAILDLNCWLQIICYVILAAILLAILGKKLIIRIFGDFRFPKKWCKGFLFGLLLIAATIVYSSLTRAIFGNYSENANESNVESIITEMPVLAFFVICILAPVTEEITYRFGLFGVVHKKSRILAYCLGALVFGLIHTAFFSTDVFSLTKQEVIVELINLPSYIISGAILCLAYEHEGSLACSMTAHFTNNLIAYVETLALYSVSSGAETTASSETVLRLFHLL